MIPETINNMPECLVAIDDLNDNPGPYCMSFGFDIKKLAESIEKAGLINKPLVCRNSEGRIEIVTGYRRIFALKSMGWEKIPCIDISDSAMPSLEMLLLNLYDNYSIRSFNTIEKAMILNRLSLHLPRDLIIRNYANIIGISNTKEIDLLIKTEALDNEVKDLLAIGALNPRMVESFAEIEHGEVKTILQCITGLKLNHNQQIQLIEYINDILSREIIFVRDLLMEEQYMNLLSDEHLNIPQRAKRFMNMLRIRRLPVITEMEERFSRMIARLNLPEGVRINHPPFFEEEGYTLEMDFREGEELTALVKRLLKIDGLKIIRDPWEKE